MPNKPTPPYDDVVPPHYAETPFDELPPTLKAKVLAAFEEAEGKPK